MSRRRALRPTWLTTREGFLPNIGDVRGVTGAQAEA
jgi:hypothetical protein